MYKKINLELANGGERVFPFVANGATALRFRLIFNRELMDAITHVVQSLGTGRLSELLGTLQTSADAGGEIEADDVTPDMLNTMMTIASSGEIETVYRLAYIMNQSAEGASMRMLNMDTYLDWLEQFEAMALLAHAVDFIGLYLGNRATTSTSKKKLDPPTGK